MFSQKLVHLDFKGAPPKISYLLNVLPLLKSWGITGLLVEYEDTFPYEDEISVLSSSIAYSKEEMCSILHCCKLLSLEVIPLVQTFGHIEFVLKHSMFSHLRENELYPNCLCPSNPESFELIYKMLKQIIALHQDMKWIHIGCDEVWHIGHCHRCKEFVVNYGVPNLFMQYVQRIASFIKLQNPNINVIIWDDMLRDIDMNMVLVTDLAALIEPMVWYYGAGPFPGHVLPNYSKVFKRVWAATAFKGASGCAKTVPDINLHIENHKLWLAVVGDEMKNGAVVDYVVLTGWSRYDHFGVLCELLPAGLPSLALCVAILKNGVFDEQTHCEASVCLGLQEKLPLCHKSEKTVVEGVSFPGKEIYLACIVHDKLIGRFQSFVTSSLYTGWLNKYNVKRNFLNPGIIDQLVSEAQNLLSHFIQLKVAIQEPMNEVYPLTVVNEWIGEHIDTYIEKLKKVINIKSNCLN